MQSRSRGPSVLCVQTWLCKSIVLWDLLQMRRGRLHALVATATDVLRHCMENDAQVVQVEESAVQQDDFIHFLFSDVVLLFDLLSTNFGF